MGKFKWLETNITLNFKLIPLAPFYMLLRIVLVTIKSYLLRVAFTLLTNDYRL